MTATLDGKEVAQILRDRGVNAVWSITADGFEAIVTLAVGSGDPKCLDIYPISEFEGEPSGSKGAAGRILNKMWNGYKRG